jgi:hypothetical protein
MELERAQVRIAIKTEEPVMRAAAIGVVAAVVVVVAGAGVDQRVREDSARNKIEGTWEHTFEGEPRIRQIKVINQDHFIWVTYEKESGLPLAAAGGGYTLQGNTYKERVEFGRFGTDELQKTVGKEQTFQIKIEGDTLLQVGTLSNGQELREVWKRVKP